MRKLLIVLISIVCAAGCHHSSSSDADSCQFAKDGVCDEPVNCAYGTDSTDCIAACAQGVTPFITGACAYRNPTTTQPVDTSVGTNGTLNLIGHRDGVISGVPSGSNPATLIDRHYRVFVPPTYNPKVPMPLVVMLPGNDADIYWLADYTQLPRTADMNRFIVVYAEQEWRWNEDGWSWWTDWDWVNQPTSNPDLYFLKQLVTRMEGDYNVDRTRVYAVGHSRGAAMALIAAFELPDLFAGACSESGFSEYGYQTRIQAYSGRKMPLVFVHGTIDTDVCVTCNINGTCAADGQPCGDVVASDALVAMLQQKGWTSQNLVYYRLDNLGHQWQPQLNQEMWDFLNAMPLTGGAQ
jgi:predicted esterase